MFANLGVLSQKHRCLLVFLIFFCLSLGVRITSLTLDPIMMRDSSFYIYLASAEEPQGVYWQIIIDRANIPPLPIFLIKSMMKLGFSAELCGRSISLFIGSIIPFIGYYITRKAFRNELPAIICGLVLLFHPYLITYSTQPLRENFYLFCGGLAIIFFLSGVETRKSVKWLLCGALSSLAFFCRYEALEFLIFFPVIYLFIKKGNTKRYLLNVVVFFLSFLSLSLVLVHVIGLDSNFFSRIPEFLSTQK